MPGACLCWWARAVIDAVISAAVRSSRVLTIVMATIGDDLCTVCGKKVYAVEKIVAESRLVIIVLVWCRACSCVLSAPMSRTVPQELLQVSWL